MKFEEIKFKIKKKATNKIWKIIFTIIKFVKMQFTKKNAILHKLNLQK